MGTPQTLHRSACLPLKPTLRKPWRRSSVLTWHSQLPPIALGLWCARPEGSHLQLQRAFPSSFKKKKKHRTRKINRGVITRECLHQVAAAPNSPASAPWLNRTVGKAPPGVYSSMHRLDSTFPRDLRPWAVSHWCWVPLIGLRPRLRRPRPPKSSLSLSRMTAAPDARFSTWRLGWVGLGRHTPRAPRNCPQERASCPSSSVSRQQVTAGPSDEKGRRRRGSLSYYPNEALALYSY